MGEVIDFPVHDRSFEKIERWIVDTCIAAGLTREQALAVVDEYRPFHDDLFDMEKSKLSLPAEVALSPEQAEKIIPAVRDLYIGQLSHAAHIIIGLLARQYVHS